MNNSAEPATIHLNKEPDYLAPDTSEIRLLPSMNRGSMCHCTLPAGKVSVAVKHKTIEEIWYILEGEGEMWRKDIEGYETITKLEEGISVTIPTGICFQFRNVGSNPLKIIIATMPPWPGDDEAVKVESHWQNEILHMA